MGTPRRLNIGVLTSSRADYGIYLPLLRRLKEDNHHNLEIIAFGTHLSGKHGHTIDAILADGFVVTHRIETIPSDDTPEAITISMGETMKKFATLWAKDATNYDLVFCLGDRYEMFAAVASSAAFQIKLAHIHGGETTLGAIDNAFRHSISQFCQYHFTSTEEYSERVRSLVDDASHIYTVGAPGLDNFASLPILSVEAIRNQFGVAVDEKTILCTFHPETRSPGKNSDYAHTLVSVLRQLDNYRVLITLPNADTSGNTVRKIFTKEFEHSDRVSLVENLGTAGYLGAMRACAFVLGNSSSGIIEAASLGKYVIDIGDRQKGRAHGKNVFHCGIVKEEILALISVVENLPAWKGENIYFNGGAARQIISRIENALC